MKIEKISETQVKFILTRQDLLEHDMHSFSDLTYNSDKAQRLFREMMELAATETGFYPDHSPLIIEALPISGDCFMIIVSKADGKKDDRIAPLQGLFDKLFRAENTENSESFINSEIYNELKNNDNSRFKDGYQDSRKIRVPKNIAIYSFDSLDDVSLASTRLNTHFRGSSSLYKLNGKFFICLQLPYKSAVLKMNEYETILGEYGNKHISNSISRGFLLEHGELIINSNAVSILSSI